MILLLDTSTPVCKLALIDGNSRYDDEWQADRQLAKGLLAYLHDQLEKNDKTLADISGIGAFMGPGSFTGLRIGLTVVNTLAEAESIPIVGTQGDDWQERAIARLHANENDQIVLPYYGSDAKITTPRK
jgi:tRNA threonylcarbamoyladenosine biosynthesis protein TsaB